MIVLTVGFGTAYVMCQQILRMNANDPQVQIAHDTAVQLKDGKSVENVVGTDKVNLAQSLASFVIVYNKSGNPIAGSGYLNGAWPKVPLGVLKAAEGQSDNRVTWQPQSDVRLASVTVAAKNYYVLSGRSLREVENREQKITLLALAGWVTALIVTVVAFILRKSYVARST